MRDRFLNKKKKKNSYVPKSYNPVDKINSAALDLANEANSNFYGLRRVNRGAVLEVVRRSLVKTAGEAFSIQKHQALSDVSQFVTLAQRNKVVASASQNADLLPVAHPRSSRSHEFSAKDLQRARARWVADDPGIKDEQTRQFVVAALCASAGSPEAQYAVARLKSLPAGSLPQSVLVSISNPPPLQPLLAWGIPGVNVSSRLRRRIFRGGNSRIARSARARRQRRDRFGRFAWMGAALKFTFFSGLRLGGTPSIVKDRRGRDTGIGRDSKGKLVGKPGEPSIQPGRVVGQSPDSNTFDVELPDGSLVRVPASKAEAVKAILAEDLTKGKTSKVSITDAKNAVTSEDIEVIDAPAGFERDTSWSPEQDDVSYYGKNTDNGTLYTDEAYDVLQFKTSNAQAKDRFEIAQQKEAEGQDIVVLGAGEDNQIDESKPVFFLQRRDGQGRIFGVAQSWADVQRFISRDQKLFEKDEPVDPKSLERWEAENPEGETLDELPEVDEGGEVDAEAETPEPPQETPETPAEEPGSPEWKDRFGRSIPVGRPVNFKVRDSKNRDLDVYGEFAGDSDKEGFGLVRVEGDTNVPDGIYEVSSDNGSEFLPSYKPEYLESVGIQQGVNEDGEPVSARTPEQIPGIDEIVRRDLEDVDESQRPQFEGWEEADLSKQIDEYVESQRDTLQRYEQEKTDLWNESQEPDYDPDPFGSDPPSSEPVGTVEERTEAALEELRSDFNKKYKEDNYVYTKGDNQLLVNKRLAQRDPEYVKEVAETTNLLIENEPVPGGVTMNIKPRLSARVNVDGIINTFSGGDALRGQDGTLGRPTTINMHYRNALNFRGLDNPLDVLGERLYVPFAYDGMKELKRPRATVAHEWGHAKDYAFGEGGGAYTKELKKLIESDPSALDGLGWYGRTKTSEGVAEYFSQYVGEKYYGAESGSIPDGVREIFETDFPELGENNSFNSTAHREAAKYSLPENDFYNADGSRKEGVEDKYATPEQIEAFEQEEGETELPEPAQPEPPADTPTPAVSQRGDGLYEVDRGDYVPQGAGDDVESEDYTDDPTELAQRFDSEELEQALEEAVRNGEGEALLPFEDGDEYVPAEAIYNALKEQGRDPDSLLDDIYAGRESEESEAPEEDVEGLPEDEEAVEPLSLEEIAENREELNEMLPELLRGLTDEELAQMFEEEDYSPYLPENDEFDVPEGMYEMDPNPFPVNQDLAPEDAPEGSPNTPLDLALDMSSEDLENMLRQSLSETEEFRPGYAGVLMTDDEGEVFQYEVPAEAIRDALQLQGLDTNEIIGETYQNNELTPDEAEEMFDGEDVDPATDDELEEIEDGGEPGAESDSGGPGGSGEDVSEPEADGRGDFDGESPWSSLDNPVAEAARAAELREQGLPTPEIFELDPEQDAEAFVQVMEGLKEGNEYASSVFVYDVEEYRNMRLFSTADGKAGFGLKPNGDIVSVFIYSDSPHRKGTASMLAQAVEMGGDRLDAYDTVLPKIYAEAGFKPVSRVRWSDGAAPDDWDKELYSKFNNGEPDVVAMAYDPDRVGSEYDPEEGEYFDDYDEAMAARDASLDSTPETTPGDTNPIFDTSDWTRTGEQAGSNEGGFFEDAQGNQYYVKVPRSEDHARNEVAASALYEAAGMNVGRVYFGRNADGDTVLVSPIIPDVDGELRDFLDDEAIRESAYSGFAVDAWLNNWDAVGLVYDNMLVKDGEVFRIDPGGSLFYRAQGADKDLPDDVSLIESLRNPNVNQQSADIFGGMSDEDVRDSVANVAAISPEKLSEVVDEIYADDPARGNEVKDKLLARREWLIDNYGEADPAETPETPEEEAERPFGENSVVLDFDSELDLEEQISEVFANNREMVFSYDGLDRLVRPVGAPELNENTGNVNVLTVDSDGNYKKFTISKMEPAESTPDLNETETPGQQISVDDAEISPTQLEKSSKQLNDVLDDMFETTDLTSTDIEDFGEGTDVDDDLTDGIVQAIDGFEDSDVPGPETPEQKILADSVQSIIDGDIEDAPSSVEDLLQASQDIDQTNPDIIWKDVLDSYNGKPLSNGHIVVSSTMHGDRRYDVLVRRQNDNTFHIYHRVTFPDGTTKIKEMGNKGWHSSKALFKKVNAQIDASRNSPETTVNKNLKSENAKTLYADTSAPKQFGSYVDVNGDIIKEDDMVVVVNESHSKFGVRARVVKTEPIFTGSDTEISDQYKYTDYMRVQYEDDGSFNWIVSQSTMLEDSDTTPSAPETSGTPDSPVPADPESSLSAYSSGQSLTYEQANALPKGAVVVTADGTLIRSGGSGVWVKHMDSMNMPYFFASDAESWFQSYDPNYKKDLPAAQVKPIVNQPTPETDDEDAVALPEGAPSSGTEYEKTSFVTGEKPKVYDDDSANTGIMQSHLQTFGSGQAFANEYAGASNLAEMEELYRAAFNPGGEKIPDNDTPILPIDRNGQKLAPGAIVNVGNGFNTFGIVTDFRELNYPNTPNSGTVDIVLISGPQRGTEWVGVEANELAGNSTFMPASDVTNSFNVYMDNDFKEKLRAGKRAIYNPTVYQNEDMVFGPGFEDEPELESLPAWDTSASGVKTVEDIMKDLRNFSVKGQEASDGYYTLIDSSAIEDGQVRFQRVVNSSGDVEIRLTGKLTHWVGNDLQTKLSGDGNAVAESAIKLDKFDLDKLGEGSLVYTGSTPLSQVDIQSKGTTYIGQYGRAKINFFRALPQSEDDSLSGEDKTVSFFEDPRYNRNPVTFHNMFDVRLPENASQGDIERALKELGVANARPATDVDLKNIAENKLISLFGNITDGARNPSNVLRQQELQKIKEEWGVTADDITVDVDTTAQQRPAFLLPQPVADKIAERTGLDVVYHKISASSGDVDEAATIAADILTSGRLESTLGRHLNGDFVAGSSSYEDVFGPGAHYSFFFMNTDFEQNAGGLNYNIKFVFETRDLFRRFDFYANKRDGWGALSGPNADALETINNREANAELMFKQNVSFEALNGISMTPEVRERVREILRDRGIDEIGGKSVDSILNHDVDQYT